MLGMDEEIREKAEKHVNKFSKVLKNCLGAKNEEILIISDYGYEDNRLAPLVGSGFHQAALNKGYKANILFQDIKKGFMHADDHIINSLNRLGEKSIVILSASNKLGRLGNLGNSFRTFCRNKKFRFISTTGLGGANSSRFDILMESIDVNYTRMRKHGMKIKNILDRAKKIRVKTEKGTDVTFDVEGKKAISNVGDYREFGQGGNIPAGEVYIPPRGLYGVEGRVVIDGSMRHDDGTILLKEPLELIIDKGKITKMHGPYKELMEQTLIRREDRAKYPERIRCIGELGIGINPKAVIIGSSILDEKVLGTAHVAIGSNAWFGGDIRTILHLDQVFMDPKIFIDGELLKV